MKIKGLVLAAGYGSRLAPLTDHVPKPLLPVCGKELLLSILERLRASGVGEIAVNTHHLGEQITECVQSSGIPDVTLFPEKVLLGTAGPLINARKFLSDCDCFVLHNGDVFSNFDLKRMISEHRSSGAVLTMAVIDGPENCVHVEGDRVVDILDRCQVPYSDTGRKLTYSCISVFSPAFLKYLPEEVQFYSFGDAWITALKDGALIRVFHPDSGYVWNDIGSFGQYFEVHREHLKNTLLQGKGCSVSPDARFSGFNVLGDSCTVGPGTHLHDCIVLPSAKVRSGYSAYTVFGRDFSCHRDEREWRNRKIFEEEPEREKLEFISLPEQGSDRKFIRVRKEGMPDRVLMISGERDQDFDRFTSLGEFFSRHHLPTPELYRVCREEYTVLMEDLGREMLYDRCFHAPEEVQFEWYHKTLEALADFQRRVLDAAGEEDRDYRLFTWKLLRWESAYFEENFLGGICRMVLTDEEKELLGKECDRIADAAEQLPYRPIHRDFQSQNIMITDGKIRFVDYQGSRLGPYTYDAASLIRDPYMDLSASLRRKLYDDFRKILAAQDFTLSDTQFRRDCALGSVQRNMQALGAYGFLSLRKGKTRYLAYAPHALELLLEGIADLEGSAPELPVPMLKELCLRAQEILRAK